MQHTNNITNIIVNLRIEGFHNWPDAFDEVDYLRHRHRHMFHICCKKRVTHDDRDIEIIQFRKQINAYLVLKYTSRDTLSCEFGSMSCEMIAAELVEYFNLQYCSVLEDGENGAEVIFNSFELKA